MPIGMTIALTADLHWGIREAGDAATRQLAANLRADPPDVLILAGDIGADTDFEPCLALFDDLACRKALVPGNHDVWVNPGDVRGDSWQVYSQHLPGLARKHGFTYLEHGPLMLPEADLAVVGTMNWYDYSWADDPRWTPTLDWDERIQEMRFTRGRHNDRRFVRWKFNDREFTAHAVGEFEKHLDQALAHVESAVVVTHHPAFEMLKFPDDQPPNLDQMLWRAFSGNRRIEKLLLKHAGRVKFTFSGHTHRAREGELAGIRGYNIGGDYDWKRLLRLRWPAGTVEAREFRVPQTT